MASLLLELLYLGAESLTTKTKAPTLKETILGVAALTIVLLAAAVL